MPKKTVETQLGKMRTVPKVLQIELLNVAIQAGIENALSEAAAQQQSTTHHMEALTTALISDVRTEPNFQSLRHEIQNNDILKFFSIELEAFCWWVVEEYAKPIDLTKQGNMALLGAEAHKVGVKAILDELQVTHTEIPALALALKQRLLEPHPHDGQVALFVLRLAGLGSAETQEEQLDAFCFWFASQYTQTQPLKGE